MEQTTEHPAVQLLKCFFSEMNAWEAEASRQYKSIEWGKTPREVIERDGKLQRQKLVEIFEKYCEVGTKAKRLQDQGLAFNLDQPEYDPERELILSVLEKPRKVVIETQRTYQGRFKFKYEVVQVGAGWRVRDNRKISSERDPPKWEAHCL